MIKLLVRILALSAASVSGARANDTMGETALGGLSFKKSDAIRMDSEDLFISKDRVRVKYRFTNTSDAPIETLVAFPLPDITPDTMESQTYWGDLSELKFKTTIDGKPIAYDIVQQAIHNGADVTARVKAAGLPINFLDENFDKALEKTPQAERQKLAQEGLLRDVPAGGEHFYTPNWSLRVSVTRTQTFPPNASVLVEHEYAPLAGGSVGGGLSKSQRKSEWFREEQRKFCIDKGWLESFDRRATRKGDAYSEVWLGYVLTTGANWKGPIGDFRLVVDKGDPNALVSFCADGVRKISPTQFEARYADFTPKNDLHVLIVDWLKE